MDIDIERLKVDREYWSIASVLGTTYYDKETGFFCDEMGYYTKYGFNPWNGINPRTYKPGRFIPRPKAPEDESMKAPTEKQLNDPEWWDENAPSGCKKVGVAYIDGKPWSHEFMPPGVTAIGAPCNAEVKFFGRPTEPSAPEWDGEGLPPVGVECEYTARTYSSAHPSISPNHWYRGTIIAYHDGAVWTSDNGIRRLSNTIFRPIKTRDQRQRDELIEILSGNWLNSDMDQLADAILSKYNLEPKP